jgi:hypothetical protein
LIAFLFYFSVTYLAATFMMSGLGHALRFSHLTQALREHGILSAGSAMPAAALLTVFELMVAAFATRALVRSDIATIDFAVLGACSLAGTGFVLYLRRLLLTSKSSNCGCLPISAPLTSLSLAPAGAVAGVSAIGFACGFVLLQSAPYVLQQLRPAEQWLPLAWGLILAGLVVLVPASMPQPLTATRR